MGCSLSLVSPAEEKMQIKIVNALSTQFQASNLDSSLLQQAQERVNLACKIYEAEKVQQRCRTQNAWFLENAEEAGLEMDEFDREQMLDLGLTGGDKRDQTQLAEARRAKSRLRQLLRQPMQSKRFSKFFVAGSNTPEVIQFSGGSLGQDSNKLYSGKKKRRSK